MHAHHKSALVLAGIGIVLMFCGVVGLGYFSWPMFNLTLGALYLGMALAIILRKR